MIVLVVIALAFIYLAGNVLKQVLRNKRAFRNFEKSSKNLSILPKPSIFFGHALRTWWSPINYELIHNLHAIHGKTFAYFIGEKPALSTMDLDLIKLAIEKHNDRVNYGVPIKEFEESILQVNGEKWRRIRRVVGPTMTNYKVHAEPITAELKKVVNQLRELLEHESRKSNRNDSSFEIDAIYTARRFAIVVISMIAFKQERKIEYENERDLYVDEITEAIESASNPFVMFGLSFPFLVPLIRFLTKYHKFGRKMRDIVDIAKKVSNIDKGSSKKELSTGDNKQSRRRLADEIIDSYLANKISFDEMSGSLMFLFVSGYETTAASISNLSWQLAQHPEIQEKLRSSILDYGADSEYLHWCIMESLRLFPPVPLACARVIANDIEYEGCLIPKGTCVVPSVYSIHRNPQIWPEPDAFKPERWANQNEFHPAAFLGFGLGQRNCVGGKLAMHEIKLVFQMLMTNYRIEKCPSTPYEYKFISPIMIVAETVGKVNVKMVPLVPATTTVNSAA